MNFHSAIIRTDKLALSKGQWTKHNASRTALAQVINYYASGITISDTWYD